MTIRLGLVSVATLGVAATSALAQVPWSNANGVGPFFNWTGGQSDLGRFGDPTLVGSTFNFFPTNFQAQSVNGTPDALSDRLQVRLTAHPNNRFTQIKITEFGSWSILGIGSVSDSGTMFLQDMITPRPPAINNLQTNPIMPINTPNSSGNWSGVTMIDLTSILGPDWTDLTLIFTNTLQANSAAGSSASIHKKLVGGPSIVVEIFPTPGSLGVLGLGAVVAMRRRRR
ncbi:MAG: MYXO-CTERM sorting domain-containing protein [Phycisphaerales bacterium]